MIRIITLAICISVTFADCYLAYPKGSNNRLNEKSANRKNANRLFDSQNNNRGGYNVGEMHDTNGFDNGGAGPYPTDAQVFDYENTDWKTNAGKVQFEEPFLENSNMKVTYTVQHGCGNPKNNCNMVFEYTCDTHPQDATGILENNYNGAAGGSTLNNNAAYQADKDYTVMTGLRVQLKNGLTTATPNAANNLKQVKATYQNNNQGKDARAESEEWYALAKQRKRNKGLFTADQKLQGDDQTKTRQNPGGTRRGLEVPEERDYFPWWNPTIWRPVFIAHNSVEECEKQMRDKSVAVETKTACAPLKTQVGTLNNNQLQAIVRAQTKTACTAANGQWIEQKFDMPAPKCLKAVWSQANNLGNVANTPDGGLPQSIDWNIPSVAEMAKTGCYVYQTTQGGATQEYVRFQTRLRYNMSTMDYDPYKTNEKCNQDKNARVQSPVNQNPTVDIGVKMQGLRLALNTAQTGRVFQDRSHVMRNLKVPTSALKTKLQQGSVLNVNVQGKRGNIVQTFPAVEYDFWPRRAELKVGGCLAFQWTGSNTHNNGNPAGDGQAGDAGEGRGGSDRSNLIQLMDKNSSYPLPLDMVSPGATNPITSVVDFFANADCYRTYTGAKVNSGPNLQDKDCQAYLLSAGFYQKMQDVGKGNQNDQLNVLLNNTPASMRGMTVCPKKKGTYDFTCTRNNNFSNRDQKLTIVVS